MSRCFDIWGEQVQKPLVVEGICQWLYGCIQFWIILFNRVDDRVDPMSIQYEQGIL